MSTEGVVIGCHTVQQWEEQFQKHFGSQKLVVVDFTASWCGPCRVIAPILADFAKRMPDVTFLKVDVDELESIARKYSVQAMPTFLFFKKGEIVHKVVGAKKDELHNSIVKHAEVADTVSSLKGYQELAKASGFEAGELSEELAQLAKQSAEVNNIQP